MVGCEIPHDRTLNVYEDVLILAEREFNYLMDENAVNVVFVKVNILRIEQIVQMKSLQDVDSVVYQVYLDHQEVNP